MRTSHAAVVWVFLLFGSALAAGDVAVEDEEAHDRSGRIIAMQSIKTIITTTTSTTTGIATCLKVIKTTACRRRRKRDSPLLSPLLQDSEPTLDSSLTDSNDSTGFAADDGLSDQKERMLAYTVWWTSTSTYILYSTTAATTMSVSYMCSIAGANYPAAC